jgi:hypothetical protein
MQNAFLTLLVAGVALVILFVVWGGIHLLARKRLGDRKLGCRGPVVDADGRARCCQGLDMCQETPRGAKPKVTE